MEWSNPFTPKKEKNVSLHPTSTFGLFAVFRTRHYLACFENELCVKPDWNLKVVRKRVGTVQLFSNSTKISATVAMTKNHVVLRVREILWWDVHCLTNRKPCDAVSKGLWEFGTASMHCRPGSCSNRLFEIITWNFTTIKFPLTWKLFRFDFLKPIIYLPLNRP